MESLKGPWGCSFPLAWEMDVVRLAGDKSHLKSCIQEMVQGKQSVLGGKDGHHGLPSENRQPVLKETKFFEEGQASGPFHANGFVFSYCVISWFITGSQKVRCRPKAQHRFNSLRSFNQWNPQSSHFKVRQIYKLPGFPKELRWLFHSVTLLLSHKGNPSCWNEASRKTAFPKICTVGPGTRRNSASVRKWDSEASGHIYIHSPTKSQPHTHIGDKVWKRIW